MSPPPVASPFTSNHLNAMVNNQPVQYASLDRKTLDFRHMHQTTVGAYHPNHVEFRQPRNGVINEEFRSSAGSELMANGGIEFNNLNGGHSTAGIAQQQQQHMNVMGPTIPPPVMPRGNASLSSNNISKESNRNINSRNHIITDTLPGPESCV